MTKRIEAVAGHLNQLSSVERFLFYVAVVGIGAVSGWYAGLVIGYAIRVLFL